MLCTAFEYLLDAELPAIVRFTNHCYGIKPVYCFLYEVSERISLLLSEFVRIVYENVKNIEHCVSLLTGIQHVFILSEAVWVRATTTGKKHFFLIQADI